MSTQARLRSLILFISMLGVMGPFLGFTHAVESTNYRLNPSDIIRMVVFQEPDLQRDVRVAQDGSVVLPLIGKVTLAGKSVFEAEELVTELYNRDYLVNPQINITVLEYAERAVSVMGSVNRPGRVVFPPEEDMDLLQAITLAGSFSRVGDRKKVKLTRTLPGGQTESYEINTNDLISGDNINKWQLQEGDVIFVPEIRF